MKTETQTSNFGMTPRTQEEIKKDIKSIARKLNKFGIPKPLTFDQFDKLAKQGKVRVVDICRFRIDYNYGEGEKHNGIYRVIDMRRGQNSLVIQKILSINDVLYTQIDDMFYPVYNVEYEDSKIFGVKNSINLESQLQGLLKESSDLLAKKKLRPKKGK